MVGCVLGTHAAIKWSSFHANRRDGRKGRRAIDCPTSSVWEPSDFTSQQLGGESNSSSRSGAPGFARRKASSARAVSLIPPAGKQSGYLRLFISHAKLDGLPLAHSLRHLIGRFTWLEAFYDAD